MASCGTNCQTLRGEGGVKVTPDCCGGCVVSLDPTTLPPGFPAGAGTGTGIYETPQGAQDKVNAALVQANRTFETPVGAQAKADAARQAAIEAASQALAQHVTNHPGPTNPSTGGTGGATPEQVQQTADAAAKKAADACCAKSTADLKTHIDNCHKLKVVKGGVTPIADKDRERRPDASSNGSWTDDGSEMRSIGGVHQVFIRVKRVGGKYLPTENERTTTSHALTFVSDANQAEGYEGGPEAGNVVPDTDFLSLDPAWMPTSSFKVSAHSSFGTGSVILFNNKVYLLDWMVNNTIQTGHKIAFEYTFLKETPCEAAQ